MAMYDECMTGIATAAFEFFHNTENGRWPVATLRYFSVLLNWVS